MSDLISKDEVFDILRYLDVNFANSFDWHTLNEVRKLVEELPSADIMECARAIKDYCDKTRCEKCELAEHKVMNDTDNYLCRVHYLRPECWDLPEGEKGGE